MDRFARKAVQAVNYLARKTKGKSIERLKVIKLLWIADRYHLMHFGRTISGDRYHAMPHGPVASEMFASIKPIVNDYVATYLKEEKHSVISLNEPELKLFSESDIETLDLVWDRFGRTPQWELRDMSHEYPEWQRFQQNIESPSAKSSYPMDMDDFFRLPVANSANRADFFAVDKALLDDAKQKHALLQSFS